MSAASVPVAPDPGGSGDLDERAVVRRRLLVALTPRATRAQAAIGILFALLGFAMALQVRSTEQSDSLSTARESDLVRILDDLTARTDRLGAEQRGPAGHQGPAGLR